MNLSQLSTQVKSLSDYKPDAPSYQRDLEDIINNAYYSVWSTANWTFAHKTDYVEFQPDITPTLCGVENGDNVTVSITPIGGSIVATFSGMVTRLVNHPSLWLGNILVVEGLEYVIVKSERYYTGTDYVARVFVDQPFRTDKLVTDWYITQRYITLPIDCEEPIGLAYRPWPYDGTDYLPLKAYSLYQEAYSVGVKSSVDKSWAYVREPSTNVPAGGKLTYTLTDRTSSPTQGTFIPGDSIQVCWAYIGPGGIVGPLGEATTLSVPSTATGSAYEFSCVTTHADGSSAISDAYVNPAAHQYPDVNMCHFKILFYNANWNISTGKPLGPPKWVPINTATVQQSTYMIDVYTRWTGLSEYYLRPDSAAVPVRIKTYITNRYSPYYFQERPSGGGRIRLYPHPSGFQTTLPTIGDQEYPANDTASTSLPYEQSSKLSLYYRYTPPKLAFQEDALQIPYQIAQLVIYKALTLVCLKSNNMAMYSAFERIYDKMLVDAKKRFVTSKDTYITKGSGVVEWNGPVSYWNTPAIKNP